MRDKFSRTLKLCVTMRLLQLAYLVLNYLPLWLAMQSTPIGYVMIYTSALSESSVLSRYWFPFTCLVIIGEAVVISWLIFSSSRRQRLLQALILITRATTIICLLVHAVYAPFVSVNLAVGLECSLITLAMALALWLKVQSHLIKITNRILEHQRLHAKISSLRRQDDVTMVTDTFDCMDHENSGTQQQ